MFSDRNRPFHMGPYPTERLRRRDDLPDLDASPDSRLAAAGLQGSRNTAFAGQCHGRVSGNDGCGPRRRGQSGSGGHQADLTLRINPAMVRSRWIGIHGDRVCGWNGAGTRSPVAGIEGRFAVAERIRARNAFAVRACESSGPARGCCCFAMLPAAFGAWSPGLAGAPHHACIQSGRSRPALGGIRR